jgi:hypothetical protein
MHYYSQYSISLLYGIATGGKQAACQNVLAYICRRDGHLAGFHSHYIFIITEAT